MKNHYSIFIISSQTSRDMPVTSMVPRLMTGTNAISCIYGQILLCIIQYCCKMCMLFNDGLLDYSNFHSFFLCFYQPLINSLYATSLSIKHSELYSFSPSGRTMPRFQITRKNSWHNNCNWEALWSYSSQSAISSLPVDLFTMTTIYWDLVVTPWYPELSMLSY